MVADRERARQLEERQSGLTQVRTCAGGIGVEGEEAGMRLAGAVSIVVQSRGGDGKHDAGRVLLALRASKI